MEVRTDLDSECQDKKSCCRRIPWRNVWSHLGLYLITTAYLFLGGLIFNLLESPHEEDTLRQVNVVRENLLQNLLNISSDNWTDTARELLNDYESELQLAWEHGWRLRLESKWGYLSACFFCLTVVSTIGYGHITPATQMGRLAALIYAVIGIPLFFIFLARAGHLVSIPLRYINGKIIKSCTRCPDCDCGGGGGSGDSISRFGSTMSFFTHNINEDINYDSTTKDGEDEPSRRTADLPGIPEYGDISCKVEVLDDDDNLFTKAGQRSLGTQTDGSLLETRAKHTERETAKSSHAASQSNDDLQVIKLNKEMENGTSRQRAITRTLKSVEQKEKRVEVPISILLTLQLTYILAGAALLNVSQKQWTFLDCVYFSTITFTTVGFGDLIPNYENSANNILRTTTFISIYIVIGLILMSSCISLSQQRVLRFIRMGMKGCSKRKNCSCCRGCCS